MLSSPSVEAITQRNLISYGMAHLALPSFDALFSFPCSSVAMHKPSIFSACQFHTRHGPTAPDAWNHFPEHGLPIGTFEADTSVVARL